MRERRSNFDVTNQVEVSNTTIVGNAVCEIMRETYPGVSLKPLMQAFEDVHRLFHGEYPSYLPCDTLYHDLQHTMDVTLAVARLINGHDRSRKKAEHIGAERAILGIITALFHDSGYIRHKHDHLHFNGAEYTQVHVSRSAGFLKHYMETIGLAEYARLAAEMVHYTGYELLPSQISLPDAQSHRVGYILGTADLIAQMSDRCYLEKCRDRLYPEFVLGGLAMQTNATGDVRVIYNSAEELLCKTPSFYENEVKNRLNKVFGGIHVYEIAHFDGEVSHYIDAMGKNQAHLKKLVARNNFSELRRKPAENYGTKNFPGLSTYYELHPPRHTSTR